MKRFMLVSLMSCMLVGQVSCDWSWGNFAKGAAWTAVESLGPSLLKGAVSSLAPSSLQNVESFFSKKKKEQEESSGSLSFDLGESASGYIGSSLAGLAALKYLHNSKAAEKFCGYDNASSFAGVLSASALLWGITHGRSFINFFRQPKSQFSKNHLSSSWNLDDFTKGALETTKGIVSGGILNAIFSKLTGSKNSFRENMGYNLGSSSCNLMLRNATGIGALAFNRSDIAKKRYSGTSGAYFAGGIAASSVFSFCVACVAMNNYYIEPVIAPI